MYEYVCVYECVSVCGHAIKIQRAAAKSARQWSSLERRHTNSAASKSRYSMGKRERGEGERGISPWRPHSLALCPPPQASMETKAPFKHLTNCRPKAAQAAFDRRLTICQLQLQQQQLLLLLLLHV